MVRNYLRLDEGLRGRHIGAPAVILLAFQLGRNSVTIFLFTSMTTIIIYLFVKPMFEFILFNNTIVQLIMNFFFLWHMMRR